MAKSKDCLDSRKRWLETLKQLNKELLELTPTTQLPATASSTVAPPPYNAEGGSTEMWPTPALYNNGDILMGDISNEATNKFYGE